MKKTLLLLPILIFTFYVKAQNVGVGTTTPTTTLDVKGGIRNQPLYLTGSGTAIIIPDNQSNINLTGNFSGQFSATINNPEDGQRLVIDNISNQTGALIGGPDIRGGLNEYIFSDGEWKVVNTNSWGLNGNFNTNSTTQFIGTTDKTDIVFKRFNNEKMRIGEAGIEIANEILPNGVAGAAGQLLQSNGNGTMSWGNQCNYKYFRQFLNSTTWIVPANITTFLVEIWGGGGGGSRIIPPITTSTSGFASGGGGGSYAKALFTSTPGTTITITVGTGGLGGTGAVSPLPALDGLSSTVSSTSQSITVSGGKAASVTSNGIGGLTYSTTDLITFIFERGKDGQHVKTVYSQSSATNFLSEDFFGRGGDAGNSIGSGGDGGYFKRNITTMASGVSIRGSDGQNYGGGGGGGYVPAGSGANGTIIIYY